MIRFALASLALSLTTASMALAEDLLDTIPVEPGGTLRVDLDRGDVTVRSHDVDAVRIEAHAHGLSALLGGFELQREGNDVHLQGLFRWSFLLVPWGPRVTVDAWVPQRYSVAILTRGGHVNLSDLEGSAVAKTSGGRIDLDSIRGPVSVDTSGGAIQIAHVLGSVVAHTSGGRVDIAEIDGNVEARTSGGAVDVRDVSGRIEATTSGGAIEASFRDEPSGILQTSGGRIEVTFPATASVDLDAETSGGTVSVEHALVGAGEDDRRRVVGKINGGGALLRLRTSGGNIVVRAS